MQEHPFSAPDPPLMFVGREQELKWLARTIYDSDMRFGRLAVFVSGLAGIGKTALVAKFLHSDEAFEYQLASPADSVKRARGRGDRWPQRTAWIDAAKFDEQIELFESFVLTSYSERAPFEVRVVLDGADALSEDQLRLALGRIRNLKAVRALIVTSRNSPEWKEARILRLHALPTSESRQLVENELEHLSLPSDVILRILEKGNGNPLAISTLNALLRSGGIGNLDALLTGRLYDLTNAEVGENELISAAKPKIISVNEAMVSALKKRPADIFSLSPRQYEHLVAELLSDMGYDVELTPATRDGGKDILAYLKTNCNTFLCLVEAKRYRSDRKIGIEIVRTLYGTLCDSKANSGMIVTTSSFSKDAHEFENKYQYQLALRDYRDVSEWIQNYGKHK
jgi:restriction system protein